MWGQGPWPIQYIMVSWIIGFIALILWALLSALDADEEPKDELELD